MKYYVDPSLHVIDTERAFIISTKTIHLQFNLKEEDKKKVYETIRLLKLNQLNIEDMLCDSSFESQLIKVCMNKGIMQEIVEVEHMNVMPGIKRIVGDRELLKVLNETLAGEWEILEDNNLVSLHCLDDQDGEIFVYLLSDSIVVSMNEIENIANEQVTNLQHVTYMAFVLIEKMDEIMSTLTEKECVKIDVTFYENELTTIVMNDIDEHTFFNSMFTMNILQTIRVAIDYERYFPLVHVTYINTEKQQRVEAFGFDKYDSARNLLFMLRDVHDEITIQEPSNDGVNHPLNSASFIGKFANLYFAEELHVQDESDKPYSYLLTRHVNNKGGIRDGVVPVQL